MARNEQIKTTDILALPGRGFPRLVGEVEGLYMHSHQVTSEYLARRLGHVRILEICCGVGAVTAALSKEAKAIFGIDLDPLRIKCAEINLETYGNPERVTFKVVDALSEAVWLEARPDVAFADPDWAKPGDIKSDHTADLTATQPPVPDILSMARRMNVSGVVLRLSLASDLSQLARWDPYQIQKVFVDGAEKYWLAYFGSVCKLPGIIQDLQLRNP